jgi:hypothetical protein
MSKADLARLSKGINTLKRMTTSLLSTRKKRRAGKKTRAGKKSKAGKKTKGKKGQKGKKRRRTHSQRGGSTISYQLGGQELSPADLNMATHAPISPSAGHSFYDMSDMKANGSFI